MSVQIVLKMRGSSTTALVLLNMQLHMYCSVIVLPQEMEGAKDCLRWACECAEWKNDKWTNLKSGILKSNKYNCKNIVVTEQRYPGLCHPWIVLARHWTKIAVLFALFWDKWFPAPWFACLSRHLSRHGSVLRWKYIWIWHSRRS